MKIQNFGGINSYIVEKILINILILSKYTVNVLIQIMFKEYTYRNRFVITVKRKKHY